MAGAVFLEPRRGWRFGLAFGAAILIHCGAIAFANIHRDQEIDDAGMIGDPGYHPVTIDWAPPVEDSTSPPEPMETPPPVVPDEDSFREEHPTPPPAQR